MNPVNVEKYTYLMCAIFWFIFSFIEKKKIDKKISDENIVDSNLNIVSKWIVPFFTIPLLIIFFIDVIDNKPLFETYQNINLYFVSSALVSLLFTGLFLYWVVLKNGAETIAEHKLFNIKTKKVATLISIVLFSMNFYGIIDQATTILNQ